MNILKSLLHDGKLILFAIDSQNHFHYSVRKKGFEPSAINQTQPSHYENWQRLPLEESLYDPSNINHIKTHLAIEHPVSAFTDSTLVTPIYGLNTDGSKRPEAQASLTMLPKASLEVISALGYLVVFWVGANSRVNVARFILDGINNQLLGKLDVRYRRSRQRYTPANDNQSLKKIALQSHNPNQFDSLASKDLDGRYFYEPVTQLNFIPKLSTTQPWFAVTFNATSVSDLFYWHIFFYSARQNAITSVSIPASRKHLFKLRDFQFEQSNHLGKTKQTFQPSMVLKQTLLEGLHLDGDLNAITHTREVQATDGSETLSVPSYNKVVLIGKARDLQNTPKALSLTIPVLPNGQLQSLPDEQQTEQRLLRSNPKSLLLPTDSLSQVKAKLNKTVQGNLKANLQSLKMMNPSLIELSFDLDLQALDQSSIVKLASMAGISGTFKVEDIEYDTVNATSVLKISSLDETPMKAFSEGHLGQVEIIPPKDQQALIYDGMIVGFSVEADNRISVEMVGDNIEEGDQIQISSAGSYNGIFPVAAIDKANHKFYINTPWQGGKLINLSSYKRQGLQFHHAQDRLTIKPVEALKALSYEGEGISLNLWCYFRKSNAQQTIFASAEQAFMLCLNDKHQLTLSLQGVEEPLHLQSTKTIRFNKWQNIGLSLEHAESGITATVYLQGKSIASGSISAQWALQPALSIDPLSLGNHLDASSSTVLNGSLSDVTLWGYALSADAHYSVAYTHFTQAPDGLINYWPLAKVIQKAKHTRTTPAFFQGPNMDIEVTGDICTRPHNLQKINSAKRVSDCFENSSLLHLPTAGLYQETFQFRLKKQGEILKPTKLLKDHPHPFTVDIWGKTSANSIEIQNVTLISQTYQTTQNEEWLEVTTQFNLDQTVKHLRLFAISDFSEGWDEMDVRSHHISSLSDTTSCLIQHHTLPVERLNHANSELLEIAERNAYLHGMQPYLNLLNTQLVERIHDLFQTLEQYRFTISANNSNIINYMAVDDQGFGIAKVLGEPHFNPLLQAQLTHNKADRLDHLTDQTIQQNTFTLIPAVDVAHGMFFYIADHNKRFMCVQPANNSGLSTVTFKPLSQVTALADIVWQFKNFRHQENIPLYHLIPMALIDSDKQYCLDLSRVGETHSHSSAEHVFALYPGLSIGSDDQTFIIEGFNLDTREGLSANALEAYYRKLYTSHIQQLQAASETQQELDRTLGFSPINATNAFHSITAQKNLNFVIHQAADQQCAYAKAWLQGKDAHQSIGVSANYLINHDQYHLTCSKVKTSKNHKPDQLQALGEIDHAYQVKHPRISTGFIQRSGSIYPYAAKSIHKIRAFLGGAHTSHIGTLLISDNEQLLTPENNTCYLKAQSDEGGYWKWVHIQITFLDNQIQLKTLKSGYHSAQSSYAIKSEPPAEKENDPGYGAYDVYFDQNRLLHKDFLPAGPTTFHLKGLHSVHRLHAFLGGAASANTNEPLECFATIEQQVTHTETAVSSRTVYKPLKPEDYLIGTTTGSFGAAVTVTLRTSAPPFYKFLDVYLRVVNDQLTTQVLKSYFCRIEDWRPDTHPDSDCFHSATIASAPDKGSYGIRALQLSMNPLDHNLHLHTQQPLKLTDFGLSVEASAHARPTVALSTQINHLNPCLTHLSQDQENVVSHQANADSGVALENAGFRFVKHSSLSPYILLQKGDHVLGYHNNQLQLLDRLAFSNASDYQWDITAIGARRGAYLIALADHNTQETQYRYLSIDTQGQLSLSPFLDQTQQFWQLSPFNEQTQQLDRNPSIALRELNDVKQQGIQRLSEQFNDHYTFFLEETIGLESIVKRCKHSDETLSKQLLQASDLQARTHSFSSLTDASRTDVPPIQGCLFDTGATQDELIIERFISNQVSLHFNNHQTGQLTSYELLPELTDQDDQKWSMQSTPSESLYFDQGECLTLADPIKLQSAFSLEVWVCLPCLSNVNEALDADRFNVIASDRHNNHLLAIYNRSRIIAVADGVLIDCGVNVSELAYGWHHLVLTIDRNTLKFVINGKPQHENPIPLPNVLSIDRYNNHLLKSHPVKLRLDQDFSISLLCSCSGQQGQFFSIVDEDQQTLLSLENPEQLNVAFLGNQYTTPASLGNISDQQWHYITCRHSEQQLSVYINGQFYFSVPLSPPKVIQKTALAFIRLGASQSASALNVRYKRIQLFSRALTVSQIKRNRYDISTEACHYWNMDHSEKEGVYTLFDRGTAQKKAPFKFNQQQLSEQSPNGIKLQPLTFNHEVQYIGNTLSLNQPFGQIGYFAIWDVPLSNEEVRANYHIRPSKHDFGLTFFLPMKRQNHYRFDAFYAQTPDQKINCSLTSTEQWRHSALTQNRIQQSYSLLLSDPNSYLDLSEAINVPNSDFTLAFWFHDLSTKKAHDSAILNLTNGLQSWSLQRQKTQWQWSFQSVPSMPSQLHDFQPLPKSSTLNSWNYVAVSYHDGHLTVSINGALLSPQSKGNVLQLSFEPGTRQVYLGQGLVSSISDIRLWDEQLTPSILWEQAFTRFNAHTLNQNPALIENWHLDENHNLTNPTVLGHKKSQSLTICQANAYPMLYSPTLPVSDPISNVVEYTSYAVTDGESQSLKPVLYRAFVLKQSSLDGYRPIIDARRVEELERIWVGNMQFEPTLIGFIEGAPPVPAENLTNLTNYAQAATLKLSHEITNEYQWDMTKENQTSLDTSLFLGPVFDLEGGFGIVSTIAKGRLGMRFNAQMDWLRRNQTNITVNDSTSTGYQIGLFGQELSSERFQHLGAQLYMPYNTGYAVVESGIADVFTLRLSGSKKMVSTEIKAVEDLPRDINLIEFLMNPGYTQAGSLDGQIGSEPASEAYDPILSMRAQYGSHYPASYYRQAEAAELVAKIERDDQERANYFANYNAILTTVHNEPLSDQSELDDTEESEEDTANQYSVASDQDGEQKEQTIDDQKMSEMKSDVKQQGRNQKEKIKNQGVSKKQQAIAIKGLEEWQTRMEGIAAISGKQDLVNTYVWSAQGGMIDKSESYVNTVTHHIGSSARFNWRLGFASGLQMGPVGLDLDILPGQSLNRIFTKSQRAQSAVRLDIDLSRLDGRGVTNEHLVPLMPGEKVSKYRFKTFYLSPSKKHFKAFFDTVVDDEWLLSNHESAIALRQVKLGNTNAAWRLMHRVTYVERPTLSQGHEPNKLIIQQPIQLSEPGTSATPDINAKLDYIMTAVRRLFQKMG